jgi:DNA-binding transcriptional MerR regulator
VAEIAIGDVARMSGVTARTLRHYESIGLLLPSSVGDNGYRWYGHPELLRLQRILILRALGLPLAEIAELLDEQRDEVEALREHHARAVAGGARLLEAVHRHPDPRRRRADAAGDHRADRADGRAA